MLYLVRHGQTAANAERRLVGRADVPLSDLGRDQVAAVAAALRGDGITRVVSSPLARAVATAEAFGLPVEVDDRWVEMDYGDLDGQPMADVAAEVWTAWRSDTGFRPPGGETLVEVAARVGDACRDLAGAAADGPVVVVSHVSPIKVAVAWALGVGIDATWRMFLDLASVTRVATSIGGAPILQSFNETPWRAT